MFRNIKSNNFIWNKLGKWNPPPCMIFEERFKSVQIEYNSFKLQ